MTFRIAVRRFDPAVDREPHVAPYEVHLDRTQTVLDALLHVEEQLDPTLAFRRMCRSGICGACAGLVNGMPRLFCQTLLGEAARDRAAAGAECDLLIEPLPQFRILKDLVIDMEPFVGELERVEAWLVPNTAYDGSVSPEVVERLWPVACCVLCGICADPDAGAARPHPAAVARVLRLAEDPRDAIGPARRAILDSFDEAARRHLVARLRAVCPVGVEVAPLMNHERPAE